MVRSVVRTIGWAGGSLLLLLVMMFSFRTPLLRLKARVLGQKTLEEVVDALRDSHPEWATLEKGTRLRLIAFKQERILQLWVEGKEKEWELRASYPFTGFSGNLGPKLREGDRQIPEGIYNVVSLNPNSRFHLSIELDYPNAFDRRMAEQDGRTSPGGEIFIHGGSATVGCIPIGDPAIEELFLQLALAGFGEMDVIIAPTDLRQYPEPELENPPPEWLKEKYAAILEQLRKMPVL